MLGILTGSTCGDACWHATEDICHCSCGGANHGILRTADGAQPVRTARIMGDMHQLVAVGTEQELTPQAQAENAAHMGDRYWHYAHTSREGYSAGPAKLRKATESQLAKWPELAHLRNWKEGIDPWDAWHHAPYLLWVQTAG